MDLAAKSVATDLGSVSQDQEKQKNFQVLLEARVSPQKGKFMEDAGDLLLDWFGTTMVKYTFDIWIECKATKL